MLIILRSTKVDGDQLTFAAVKNPIYHTHFLTLCPTYAFIDRATGRFNRSMGFEKDYSAILSVVHSIGKILDEYITNPCETTAEMLDNMHIPRPFIDTDSTDDAIHWDGNGLDPIYKIPMETY